MSEMSFELGTPRMRNVCSDITVYVCMYMYNPLNCNGEISVSPVPTQSSRDSLWIILYSMEMPRQCVYIRMYIGPMCMYVFV